MLDHVMFCAALVMAAMDALLQAFCIESRAVEPARPQQAPLPWTDHGSATEIAA
jgi:hypothetical protein